MSLVPPTKPRIGTNKSHKSRHYIITQEATRNKCIASSNKCLTSSNKKLLGTSASLLVTLCLVFVFLPLDATRLCRRIVVDDKVMDMVGGLHSLK